MYLQTVMLLLRAAVESAFAQECWSAYHREVAAQLSPPEEWMLFCGMAIGHADPDAPVNRLRSRRLPLDQFVQWRS